MTKNEYLKDPQRIFRMYGHTLYRVSFANGAPDMEWYFRSNLDSERVRQEAQNQASSCLGLSYQITSIEKVRN